MTTTTQRLVDYYQWVIENGGKYFNSTCLLLAFFPTNKLIQAYLPTLLVVFNGF